MEFQSSTEDVDFSINKALQCARSGRIKGPMLDKMNWVQR